jgi:1-acyl-sn-glycerol-3-phosphate acyltransferase
MSITGTKIHKFNIFYKLLKIYQLLVFHLFYKRVEVIGRKNIPYGSPIIFTPNHQNALMDALIVLDTAKINPVFMARADIFKNPVLKKILTFLKMLPIYRIRDGADELSKNDDTFNICLDILRDCYSVCLMPEGNHGDKRRLRSLVKGTFRIAFRAQEDFGDKNSVKIVPVGIDFQHYQHIQQDLLIIYGAPIEVSEYMDAYRENPAKAMNTIKDRLSMELEKIIIHIANVEHYDMFMDLRTIYNSRMRNRCGITGDSVYKRFEADKQMIRILDERLITDPDEMNMLSKKLAEYSSGLKGLKFRNWVIEKKGFSLAGIVLRSLFLILMSPVFIAGFITNIIPYIVPLRAILNVKDTQFRSSIKFGVALLFFPVYYTIIGILVGLFTEQAWIPWVFMVGMLGCGYIALFYTFYCKKLYASMRFRFYRGRKDKRLIRLLELHEEIISVMNGVTDQYMKSVIPKEKKLNN